jgi:hypothetical protein
MGETHIETEAVSEIRKNQDHADRIGPAGNPTDDAVAFVDHVVFGDGPEDLGNKSVFAHIYEVGRFKGLTLCLSSQSMKAWWLLPLKFSSRQ